MDNTIYIVLGGVFLVYLFLTITNRSKSKKRSSKRFMGDYKRRDEKK